MSSSSTVTLHARQGRRRPIRIRLNMHWDTEQSQSGVLTTVTCYIILTFCPIYYIGIYPESETSISCTAIQLLFHSKLLWPTIAYITVSRNDVSAERCHCGECRKCTAVFLWSRVGRVALFHPQIPDHLPGMRPSGLWLRAVYCSRL